MPSGPSPDPAPGRDAPRPLRDHLGQASGALRGALRALRRGMGPATTEGERTPAEIAIRLLREALPGRWKLYVLSLVCMVGVAGFSAALAWSTKIVVNDIFVAGNVEAAYGIAALMVFITLGKAFFDYVNAIIQVMMTRSIASGYQKHVFRSFVAKDVWFFLGRHAATQMAQVRMFGQAVANIVVSLSNKFLTDLLVLLALIGVMVFQDPVMSLVCVLMFPVIFALVSNLSRRIRQVAKAELDMAGAIFAIGTEAFEGIRTVKSYELEQKTIEKFNGAVETLEQRMLSIARVTSATMPLMEILGGLVIAGFVVYAAWQTLTVGKTPGEFTAFITAFLMAYQPAERLSKLWVSVQKAIMHAETMYEALETPPRRPAGGTRPLDGVAPDLQFDDVHFSYAKDAPALRGVSFRLEPGAKMAVVGRSGAGKTTLIDLLQRFYDPTEGAIRIGGHDLREISEEAMRRYIALISQDVFLFEGTIADNIRDGRPGASNVEVAEAARLAALDDTLAQLPDGLDTEVGPNGGNLSGGQKQRVGIARALLRDARIYIFDEATSALDGDNERRIMKNIARELTKATVLFVTHRTSTLAYVDRVLFLDRGEVVAFDDRAAMERESSGFRRMFGLEPDEDAEAEPARREERAAGDPDPTVAAAE